MVTKNIFYLFTNYFFLILYAFSLIVAMFVQKNREINWKFKNIDYIRSP